MASLWRFVRLGSDFIIDFIPILSQKYFIMARKPRIEYPGALFHIIARGNNREDIFHDDEDRENYLPKLRDVVDKMLALKEETAVQAGRIPLEGYYEGEIEVTYLDTRLSFYKSSV